MEPGDEGIAGQLQCLHGTRDAAHHHAHAYTTLLVEHGFKIGRASPVHVAHQVRRIYLWDDLTILAGERQLEWLGSEARKRHEQKTDVLGPSVGQAEEVRLVNRIMRQRLSEIISAELGWTTAGLFHTPCIKGVTASTVKLSEDAHMDAKDASRYRTRAAILSNLAADRPDILFSSSATARLWHARVLGLGRNGTT